MWVLLPPYREVWVSRPHPDRVFRHNELLGKIVALALVVATLVVIIGITARSDTV